MIPKTREIHSHFEGEVYVKEGDEVKSGCIPP